MSAVSPRPSARTAPQRLLDEAARLHQANAAGIAFRRLAAPVEIAAAQRLRARAAMEHFAADPAAFPDGLDRDAADEGAIHVGGYRGGELVATARMLVPRPGEPLPVERAFDLVLGQREATVEVGRVAIDRSVADRRSTVLLALLGCLWQHAGDRHRWAGANETSVVRLYTLLGAVPEILGEGRRYLGAERRPVCWDMHAFAPAFHALAERHARLRLPAAAAGD